MRPMIAAAAAALSMLCGCATHYSPAQLAEQARVETTPNLCAITLMAPPAAVMNAAENELQARAASCDWNQARAIAETQMERAQAQQQIKQQRIANSMQMLGAASVLLQQSGPHYYAPPPVQTTCIQQGVFTNCTSY